MGERTRELLILVTGDILVFFTAVWITLLVRYLSWPSGELLSAHFGPFALMSALWLCLFYVGGLYDKHTVLLKTLLFSRILNIQLVNILLAGALFVVFPFSIAPKTNLVIYLFVSVGLISVWRLYLVPMLAPKTNKRAILLADGEEAIELVDEINNNDRYDYTFIRLIDNSTASQSSDFKDKLLSLIERERVQIIVADPHSEYLEAVLPALFDKTFIDFKFTFLDFFQVYEDTFDRVPLSALRYDWFLTHVSQSKSLVYDVIKRGIDIVGCLVLFVLLILVLPFVYLAELIEGKQSGFFMWQKRLGQFTRPVQVLKLQTMTFNDAGSGTWKHEDEKKGNVITIVGKFLQKASLDELPQIWNILKGEMSLIGPRNDTEGLGQRLSEQIPYYKIRYFVKPGVTGWAQTNQHYKGNNIQPQSLEESRVRLSYDLYYVKNRSLWLDIAIALKTVKTLLSRFGVTISWPR